MTIVITLPYFFDGEAEQIVQLLHHPLTLNRQSEDFNRITVDLIHIRKPGCEACQLEKFILSIPEEYRNRLVLHDHHELAITYNLFGVHLNSRNPEPPNGWEGSISKSCHTLEEVKEWKERCNYVSLSPIFDSISKKGYLSAFTFEEIKKARRDGIIDKNVLALGGVTFKRLTEVKNLGFGGGMILGDAWKDKK